MHIRTVMCLNLKSIFMLRKFSVHMCSAEILGALTIYICSKINMARNSHSHNTRGAAKNHLQLSSANNKFGLKTFACRAPKLWNNLPSQLLEIESLLKFKTSQ